MLRDTRTYQKDDDDGVLFKSRGARQNTIVFALDSDGKDLVLVGRILVSGIDN